MPTLILGNQTDASSQQMWRTAIQEKIPIVRLTTDHLPWDKDETYLYYGNTLDIQRFSLPLATPFLPSDWLSKLSPTLTHRKIQSITARQARKITEPTFMKCVEVKWMSASVRTGSEIPPEVHDSDHLLTSDVVAWKHEYRCFCKDGAVVTSSQYRNEQGQLDIDEVSPDILDKIIPIASAAAKTYKGRGIVIDVGQLSDGRFAVIEANECWASGLYACDPLKALEVIAAEQIAYNPTVEL